MDRCCIQPSCTVVRGDVSTRDIYIPANIRNVSYSYACLLATLAFCLGRFTSLINDH